MTLCPRWDSNPMISARSQTTQRSNYARLTMPTRRWLHARNRRAGIRTMQRGTAYPPLS